jgi:hypothetical protein
MYRTCITKEMKREESEPEARQVKHGDEKQRMTGIILGLKMTKRSRKQKVGYIYVPPNT